MESLQFKKRPRASLVVQRQRIRLLMQGTGLIPDRTVPQAPGRLSPGTTTVECACCSC